MAYFKLLYKNIYGETEVSKQTDKQIGQYNSQRAGSDSRA